ncbi:MAG: hypothetical protein NTU79_14570 [Planctomycetota bacterium]|nr:hypothetical protein [Planctomycetota bacterium]
MLAVFISLCCSPCPVPLALPEVDNRWVNDYKFRWVKHWGRSFREHTVLLVRKLRIHIGPLLLAVILVLGLAVWQLWASRSSGTIVTGSSLPGLVAGSLAASIIFFELLLWPRKRLRRFKLFPTKFWLSAHLWLGLSTGPLAFIHSGYRFGGTFSTTLMCLLLFVLASGTYGWIMQIIIPKWMLGNLPFETIGSQIDDVSIQSALDARRMLTVAFGPKPVGLTKLANLDEISAKMRGSSMVRDQDGQVRQIVVGAIQRRGDHRSLLKMENTEMEFNPLDGSEVWRQYASVIEPFLLRGIPLSKDKTNARSNRLSPLRTPRKANDWFGLLRESCSLNAGTILESLEQLCEQRHQFNAQRRAQAWLHGWIAIHAGVSVMLGVLLITHIVLALKYL